MNHIPLPVGLDKFIKVISIIISLNEGWWLLLKLFCYCMSEEASSKSISGLATTVKHIVCY